MFNQLVCCKRCFLKPLFTIVLRIILTVNKPTPTKIPYCKEPDKKLTVVFPIPETQTVNKTAETAKQRAELMHMVILNPAFNFDALKSTKTVLSNIERTKTFPICGFLYGGSPNTKDYDIPFKIVFDSNFDDWDFYTSIFDDVIMERQNLLFVIEDEELNKFGIYYSSPIASNSYNTLYRTNNETFLFSLRYNGILKKEGMKKFEIIDKSYGYCLYKKSSDMLIGFGKTYAIALYKSSVKHKSYCKQHLNQFNFHGISNALLGRDIPEYFIPKRITVIQMI